MTATMKYTSKQINRDWRIKVDGMTEEQITIIEAAYLAGFEPADELTGEALFIKAQEFLTISVLTL